MNVYRGLNHLTIFQNPVLTIGTFDGVHLGHAKIINRLCNKAKEVNGESIIITFDTHPRFVLESKSNNLSLLSTLDEKIAALQLMGIDNLVIIPFTKEFSEISAHAYIQDFLVKHFHPHTIVIGYDHHFGKNREGNFDLLASVKDQYHFHLEEIPMQELQHIAISSTKIREALLVGDIKKANDLLARPYTLSGKVIHGEKRGRLLDFPTANIQIAESTKLIPANGVYAVLAAVNEKVYQGMMNIGVRPTVSNSHERSLEVHLFNFEKEIYDEILSVQIVNRLRDEKKFDGVDNLIAQLQIDKQEAIQLLDHYLAI